VISIVITSDGMMEMKVAQDGGRCKCRQVWGCLMVTRTSCWMVIC
jgi:hypothetical protein